MADTNLLPAPNGYQQPRQPLYGTLLTVPLLPGDNSSINHCEDDNQQQHGPMPPPSSIDGEDDNESLGGVTASTINPVGDDRMRRRLKYFFMTPCEKYQAKGRLPLKLLLQLLKVLLVTMQLYVFGMESSGHVYFLKTAQTAFKHLFLESWDPSWETPPYPPSHGPYAVYTYDSFYSAINFALAGYNGTASDSVGSFAPPAAANESQPEPPSLCLMHYANLTVDAANFRYVIDREVSTRCFEMLPLPDGNGTWRYDTRRLLEEEGYNLNFEIVLTAQLQFYVNSIHFNFEHPRLSAAECFLFNVSILFDNRAHTGQVQVSLIADPIEHRCSVEEQFGQIEKAVSYTILDVSVILVCLLSFVSCVRSLYKGNRMRLRTRRYFRNNFNYKLNLDEQCEFINLWFALIILNDLLTLIGSLMKILIEYKTIDNYTVCGLFLGSGAMLVWFGTLRYLGYFSKYNRRGTSQPPNSRMWAFIAECADPANSLAYRNDAGMRKRRLSTAASAADLAGWLSRWFQASLVSRVNNNNNKINNPTAAADVDLVIEQDDGERPTFLVGGNNGAGGGGEARRAVSNRRRRSRRRLRRRGVGGGGGDLPLPEPVASADAVATSSEADSDDDNDVFGQCDGEAGSSDTVDDVLDGRCLERV
ncbi:hypothetical protein BOX15_Mlig003171g4 [Macrostomum lignano]|uniref:Mucolipin extracytosolic domain-containing protein n=2 Tax=Macrostomum lignano TaxID=282301 RepID=A0A267H1P3_9PLAT|nr:hypothetical protein BOX15_Mlig003171g4 [Macrostomum lignano]